MSAETPVDVACGSPEQKWRRSRRREAFFFPSPSPTEGVKFTRREEKREESSFFLRLLSPPHIIGLTCCVDDEDVGYLDPLPVLMPLKWEKDGGEGGKNEGRRRRDEVRHSKGI